MKDNLPDALRGRRRDRHRHRRPARLRGPAAAHPPGQVAGRHAGRGDPGVVRRLRPARRRRRVAAATPFAERRRPAGAGWRWPTSPPVHLTPATDDPALAQEWFERVRGRRARRRHGQADGGAPTGPTSAPCSRSSTSAPPTASSRASAGTSPAGCVGSLLLGLYDDDGPPAARRGRRRPSPMARRAELVDELEPYAVDDVGRPPVAAWAEAEAQRRRAGCPAPVSRWNASKDLSWVPLRPELVVEVRYDHMEGTRFRHTAQLQALAPRPRRRSPAPTNSSTAPYASTWPRSWAPSLRSVRPGPRRRPPYDPKGPRVHDPAAHRDDLARARRPTHRPAARNRRDQHPPAGPGRRRAPPADRGAGRDRPRPAPGRPGRRRRRRRRRRRSRRPCTRSTPRSTCSPPPG